jgi:hypothetical protein
MASRVGALRSWANTEDRKNRTQPGRDAFLARFENEIDPEGLLSEGQRRERALLLRKAHMLQLSRKSAQIRRDRKRKPDAADTAAQLSTSFLGRKVKRTTRCVNTSFYVSPGSGVEDGKLKESDADSAEPGRIGASNSRPRHNAHSSCAMASLHLPAIPAYTRSPGDRRLWASRARSSALDEA